MNILPITRMIFEKKNPNSIHEDLKMEDQIDCFLLMEKKKQ